MPERTSTDWHQECRPGQLIRSTKRFAQEQRLVSHWCTWSTATLLSSVLLLICWSEIPFYARLASSFIAGLLIVRLFVIYHDYQHGTILRDSPFVAPLMFLVGLLTLAPPSIWKRSHNHHHKNNVRMFGSHIGSFPIMTTTEYSRTSAGARLRYRLSRHPVTILLGYATVFFWGMCVKSVISSPRHHIDSAVAIAMHMILVAFLGFLDVELLLLSYVLPLMIATSLGSYIFYAQHNFPDVIVQSKTDWDYTFAALHSSAFIRMSGLMHWFTGNIGYHHVHHVNHRIPFYRLPSAMAGIEDLQNPGTTSLGIREILKCFRLNLWDPERQRMVSFREARGSQPSTPAGATGSELNPENPLLPAARERTRP